MGVTVEILAKATNENAVKPKVVRKQPQSKLETSQKRLTDFVLRVKR